MTFRIDKKLEAVYRQNTHRNKSEVGVTRITTTSNMELFFTLINGFQMMRESQISPCRLFYRKHVLYCLDTLEFNEEPSHCIKRFLPAESTQNALT